MAKSNKATRKHDRAPEAGDHAVMEIHCPDSKDHPYLPYFWAISIFLCSRVVIALGLVFSRKYMPIDTDVWSAGPGWYHQLLQWDSEWYFRIVTEGYRYNGNPTIPQNIVFYPLYPMLARGLAAISGIGAPDALLLGGCEISVGTQTRTFYPNDPRRLESMGSRQLAYAVVHCFDFCRLLSTSRFLDTLRHGCPAVALSDAQWWSIRLRVDEQIQSRFISPLRDDGSHGAARAVAYGWSDRTVQRRPVHERCVICPTDLDWMKSRPRTSEPTWARDWQQ
jgi:hypothetical protein